MGLVKKTKAKKKTTKKVVKKKTPRRPAKKASKPKKQIYETKIDEILKIVQNQDKITFEELSSDTDLSMEETESWLKILQKNKLVHLHYPMMKKPYAAKTNHTKIPNEEPQQDNKTRNLIIFGIICFILLIIYYIFFIK